MAEKSEILILKVPEEFKERLRNEARRLNISMSELVRIKVDGVTYTREVDPALVKSIALKVVEQTRKKRKKPIK